MATLGNYFTRKNPRKVVALKAHAPQWLRDAIREAHGDMLPNDWVYEACRDASLAIDDGALTDSDSVHQYADGAVDIYTRDLAEWYRDMCHSDIYANAECEADDCGSSDNGNVDARLRVIQYFAIARIAQTVLGAWEASK